MIALGVLAAVLVAAIGVRRAYVVVTVEGESMAPTLRHGQRLLARRARRCARGDVIVFAVAAVHGAPGDPVLRVKRVAAVAGDPVPAWLPGGGRVPAGSVVVSGDNPSSQDSRQLGFIAIADVVATIAVQRTRHAGVSAVKGR